MPGEDRGFPPTPRSAGCLIVTLASPSSFTAWCPPVQGDKSAGGGPPGAGGMGGMEEMMSSRLHANRSKRRPAHREVLGPSLFEHAAGAASSVGCSRYFLCRRARSETSPVVTPEFTIE